MINPNEYYSIDDLAKKLKVSRHTLKTSLENKEGTGIPFLQIGDRKQYRLLGQDVLNALGSASYQAPSQPDRNYQSTAGVPAQNGS